MADYAGFTHKWRATTTGGNTHDANKINKRNRQPVSCQACRARKLKCDRAHPCSACTKRGEAETCVFGRALPAPATASAPARRDGARASTLRAQDRLKHLEDLVKSMVEAGPHGQASPPQEVSGPQPALKGSPETGHLNRTAVIGSTYTGSTHWTAILQHINELKNNMLTSQVDPDDEPIDYSQPDALFGGSKAAILEYILRTYLPPRKQVDRKISLYFNAKYLIVPLMHMKHFQRQYEKFWQDPCSTNVMWISIMFSICYLGTLLNPEIRQRPGNEAGEVEAAEALQKAAGHCLVLGNYSKPQPFVVEAMSLYLQAKYSASLDPQREVALIFGMQTRLAYIMGYHRDGSNFPGQFTPFETEMRRRTWAMVKQFDLMCAFQLGIPNTVPPDTWDTKIPSNLLDSDFDEDTTVLPPSRPETDFTRNLYFVVKARIMDIYAKIYHHAISFPPVQPTVSEIMALDAQLRERADSIPESLRIRPIAQSITDPVHEVMARLSISFLWRKSLCVLHRKYMVASGNIYSYRTCLEAASAMCAAIHDVYPEFQPGGTFANAAWMLTSFTIIDFLLANMILCLAMSVSRKRYVNSGGVPGSWLLQDETKAVLAILEKSQSLCEELAIRSREAKRVSKVIAAMLEKLRSTQPSQPTGADGPHPIPSTSSMPHNEQARSRAGTSIQQDNNISLQPLSISEAPQLVGVNTGISPPDWHGRDLAIGGAPAVGDIGLSPNKSSTGHTPANSERLTQSRVNNLDSVFPHTSLAFPQQFAGNIIAPHGFDTDAELGSKRVEADLDLFMDMMNGPENMNGIDWTQLDQFTGLWGETLGVKIPGASAVRMSGAEGLQAGDSGAQEEGMGMDYSDWESTPIYMLGARMRDPVTGLSQQA